MKIFIIESPNPNDLLESRNEKSSLENMCKMFGHQSVSFTIYSRGDMIKFVNYISKINLGATDILCMHFSCHGNNDGISIGPDFIDWTKFLIILAPIYANKNIGKKTFIIISACGANGQTITTKVNSFNSKLKSKITPPYYFFVYNQDTVEWGDSLMCWAILYHQLSKLQDFKKKSVQNILTRIKNSELGDIKYFRWDETQLKYLKFEPNGENTPVLK
jgi:hypothetical protein